MVIGKRGEKGEIDEQKLRGRGEMKGKKMKKKRGDGKGKERGGREGEEGE